MFIYNSSDKRGKVAASKGNQPKINLGDSWYKIDYLGYEGASEYAASELLKRTNISNAVVYKMEDISYNDNVKHGCISKNFLPGGYNIITIEELILKFTGKSSTKFLDNLSTQEKIKKTVDFVKKITGLLYFGEYLTTILQFDSLILNEDRHLHNIAVLKNENGTYTYCPIFDNGGAFLSDTILDYSLDTPIMTNLKKAKAKPFSTDFEKQAKAACDLYGSQILVTNEPIITESVKQEISDVYGTHIANRILLVGKMRADLHKNLFTNQDVVKSSVLIWEKDTQPELIELLKKQRGIESEYTYSAGIDR